MTHNIKILETYVPAILDGSKTFEIRYNDRGYQRGDYVVFQAVNNKGKKICSAINGKRYKIKFLVHGFGLQNGWCVFGIEPAPALFANGLEA